MSKCMLGQRRCGLIVVQSKLEKKVGILPGNFLDGRGRRRRCGAVDDLEVHSGADAVASMFQPSIQRAVALQ